jgi:hypothetical protein
MQPVHSRFLDVHHTMLACSPSVRTTAMHGHPENMGAFSLLVLLLLYIGTHRNLIMTLG